METTGPHHQQAGQPWASFLLSKPSLYQLLSMLHTSVSAPAAEETHKIIKHTCCTKLYHCPKLLPNKKSERDPCKCKKLLKNKGSMHSNTHIRLNCSKLIKDLKKDASSIKRFSCIPAKGQRIHVKNQSQIKKINIQGSCVIDIKKYEHSMNTMITYMH